MSNLKLKNVTNPISLLETVKFFEKKIDSNIKVNIRIPANSWVGQTLMLFSGDSSVYGYDVTLSTGDYTRYLNATAYPISVFATSFDFTPSSTSDMSYDTFRQLSFTATNNVDTWGVQIKIYSDKITARAIGSTLPLHIYSLADTSTFEFKATISTDTSNNSLPITSNCACNIYLTGSADEACKIGMSQRFNISDGQLEFTCLAQALGTIEGVVEINYSMSQHDYGYILNLPASIYFQQTLLASGWEADSNISPFGYKYNNITLINTDLSTATVSVENIDAIEQATYGIVMGNAVDATGVITLYALTAPIVDITADIVLRRG